MKTVKARAWRVLPLCLAILLLLPMGGCFLFPDEEDPVPVPLVEIQPIQYATETPTRGSVENRITGNVTLESKTMQSYSFSKSGKMAKMYVSAGQTVKTGDLLCELDSVGADVILQKAELTFDIARLVYESAEDTFLTAKSKYEQGTLAEIDWKRAQLNWLNAQSTYMAAEETIQAARVKYEGARLYATMDGVVTYATNLGAGNDVGAGVVICRIADPTDLYLRFSDIGYQNLPLYATCTITLPALGSEQTYEAVVERTPDMVPDSAPANDRLSVILSVSEELAQNVAIGALLKLDYLLERHEDALLIRRVCLRTSGSRTYVYVLEDGYRQEREVEVGIIGSNFVEILGGLDDNTKIIYG